MKCQWCNETLMFNEKIFKDKYKNEYCCRYCMIQNIKFYNHKEPSPKMKLKKWLRDKKRLDMINRNVIFIPNGSKD